MPKRNFGFEKRQKELEKQRKRAQKLQRRSDRAADAAAEPELGLDGSENVEVDPAPQADGHPTE